MLDGTVKGYFLLGENPAVGSANSRLHRLAMAQLDWLVVRDLYEIESATFWRDGPEIESGELRPEDIGTEVFFLPAAAHVEKDGTFTNTQRLLQWHTQGRRARRATAAPTCGSRYHLGRRIRERLAGSSEPRDRPVLRADAGTTRPRGRTRSRAPTAVLREINGVDADGPRARRPSRSCRTTAPRRAGAGSTAVSTPAT